MDENEGISYFTKHLVRAMETGEADGFLGGRKDCLVTLSELYYYVHYKVDEEVAREVPPTREGPARQKPHLFLEGAPEVYLASAPGDCMPEDPEVLKKLLEKIEEERAALQRDTERFAKERKEAERLMQEAREKERQAALRMDEASRYNGIVREFEAKKRDLQRLDRAVQDRQGRLASLENDLRGLRQDDKPLADSPPVEGAYKNPETGLWEYEVVIDAGRHRIEMPFVLVPGGCFQMGQSEEERRYLIQKVGEGNYDRYYADESPRREVCLDSFWIAKYEVSVDEFRAFVYDDRHETDAEKEGWAYGIRDDGVWEKKNGLYWDQPGFDQKGNHPVVNVSFRDASAMVRWMSEKHAGTFSLPTEAQWEFACRAGSETMWFWGNREKDQCRFANGADLSAKAVYSNWTIADCSDGYVYTSPSGSFEPNAFGIYDMSGNVWEWCRDAYDSGFYSKKKASLRNPESEAANDSSSRVFRGGSWCDVSWCLRSGDRSRGVPDGRRSNLGFRVCVFPAVSILKY